MTGGKPRRARTMKNRPLLPERHPADDVRAGDGEGTRASVVCKRQPRKASTVQRTHTWTYLGTDYSPTLHAAASPSVATKGAGGSGRPVLDAGSRVTRRLPAARLFPAAMAVARRSAFGLGVWLWQLVSCWPASRRWRHRPP